MKQLNKALPFNSYKDEQHKAVISIWYAGMLINETFGKVLTPYRISVEQFRIMRILQSIYPNTIPVYNINHYMHVRSDISRAITQLSQRGLVEKLTTETDKRQVPVRLSAAGMELINEAVEKIYSELLSPPVLPEDVATNTNQVMEQVIAVFEKELRKYQYDK